MLCEIARLLLDLNPSFKNSIFNFRCNWSKSKMFAQREKPSHKEVYPGLYINCNHTALHACWLIQDLLDYFGIDKSRVHFLIYRPCAVEPQEIRDFLKKDLKKVFSIIW